MCGIIAALNHNGAEVNNIIEQAFRAQRHRGTVGFGFTEVFEDEVKLNRFEDEKDALEHLKASKSPFILFHHRVPTSTGNNVVSNHPMYTDSSVYEHNYYLIHNGHIRNSLALRREHKELGIDYNSFEKDKFTDSEALLHELALVIEGKKDAKDYRAEGGAAFIMLQVDKGNNPIAMYFGRNNQNGDLKINRPTENVITLRSECATGEQVEPNILHRYDYKTKELTKQGVPMSGVVKQENKTLALPLPTKETESPMMTVIKRLYENRVVFSYDVDKLSREEKEDVLILAKRLASKHLMDYEKSLLSKQRRELYVLQNYYDDAMKTVDIVNESLK